MKNSDLIAKLSKLRRIKTDQTWLKNNRELLLSQISNSGAERLSTWKIFLINLNSFSRVISKPAYAFGIFVLLLLGGTLLSQQTLSQAKPNDSLYIARVIAENVRLNTIFDGQERNRLALKYASGRAQDISSVLADPKFNTPANQVQVAKLSANFNEELNTVKSKIEKLNKLNTSLPLTKKIATREETQLKNSSEPETTELIMADSSKTEKGISIAIKKDFENNLEEPLDQANNISGEVIAKTSTSALETLASNTKLENILSATNSIKNLAVNKSTSSSLATTSNSQVSSSSEFNSYSEASKTFDEGQKLFDAQDYGQATSKLQEADEIIK